MAYASLAGYYQSLALTHALDKCGPLVQAIEHARGSIDFFGGRLSHKNDEPREEIRRLVLQRQLGEGVAAAFVVAQAGLVLSSSAPV